MYLLSTSTYSFAWRHAPSIYRMIGILLNEFSFIKNWPFDFVLKGSLIFHYVVITICNLILFTKYNIYIGNYCQK